MSTDRPITCPTCQKSHFWLTSKPWSPFCSERCRLIDLGAWASEQHKIPGNEVSPETIAAETMASEKKADNNSNY